MQKGPLPSNPALAGLGPPSPASERGPPVLLVHFCVFRIHDVFIICG